MAENVWEPLNTLHTNLKSLKFKVVDNLWTRKFKITKINYIVLTILPNTYFLNLFRNYPIGVLYDLFISDDKEVDLPWKVIVHFDNFPEDQLIRCSCR